MRQRTRQRTVPINHWWQSPSANMVALLVFYFAMPVTSDDLTLRSILGPLLAILSVCAVTYIMGRHLISWHRGDGKKITVTTLLLLLEAALIGFALTFFVIDKYRTGEFAELNTKLDALYFSLATLATVGFGDVHATGQLARWIVTIQMVFDLVFVGAFVGAARGNIMPIYQTPSDPPEQEN